MMVKAPKESVCFISVPNQNELCCPSLKLKRKRGTNSAVTATKSVQGLSIGTSPPAADHAAAGAAPQAGIGRTPGYSGKGTRSTKSLGQRMSHEYILTDDDAAPADATHAQDILELSMLTMPQPGAPIVDISWEKSTMDL